MIFNTWAFGVFWLVAAIAYWWLSPRAARPYVLMAVGVVFYAWSVPVYTLLIFALGTITYALGLALLRIPSADRRRRAWVLAAGAGACVLALGYFKYTPLFASAFNLHGFKAVAVPLAISFFTFEFVHFISDVYLGKITRISVRDFALFTLFFPTMVAGPIKRYEQFVPQIGREHVDDATIRSALLRIALGYAKKAILADSMTPLTGPLLVPTPMANGADMIVGILAYTAKIYFDFTGYSDIAIGISQLFGYKVPENFERPYTSASIAEFWRRWHISLSSWIRDYLFIPLGGSRVGRWKTIFNLALVMGIAGLWHGAAWHFIVWGLWHGAGLTVHRLWSIFVRPRPQFALETGIVRRGIAIGITFGFVALGWVLFASPTITMALSVYRGILRP